MGCLFKKGLFIVDSLFCKVEKQNDNDDKFVIKIWLWVFMILLMMIGYMIVVYNGCIYVLVFIIEQMVGYKLGEFVFICIFKGYIRDKKGGC